VIVAVARLCETQTRDSDVAARIGGEEFAVILPETNLDDARAAAERLRAAVAAEPFATRIGPLNVTVSLGAALAEANVAGVAELMKRADEALYAAKHAGRDCVAAVINDVPVAFKHRSRSAA
jgi:diguanylate cyclase (GGDEF)-like protein